MALKVWVSQVCIFCSSATCGYSFHSFFLRRPIQSRRFTIGSEELNLPTSSQPIEEEDSDSSKAASDNKGQPPQIIKFLDTSSGSDDDLR